MITVQAEKGDEAMIQIPIERREEADPEGYVKVVRCCECRWHMGKKILEQIWCSRFNILVTYNHYCAVGERKEDNQ
jgi:hypothetical protein